MIQRISDIGASRFFLYYYIGYLDLEYLQPSQLKDNNNVYLQLVLFVSQKTKKEKKERVSVIIINLYN